MLVYLIGGYIKIYNPLRNIRATALFAMLGLVYAGIFVKYYINVMDENPLSFVSTKFSEWYIIIIAILIFEIFRRIDVGKNKIINILSASALMVFMIHYNPFVTSIVGNIDWVGLLYAHRLRYGIYFILFSIGLYLIGTVVYYLFVIFRKIAVPVLKKLFLRNRIPAS
jgi:hypothetical protein